MNLARTASSVLYGTVAELVPAERRARAFGIFYTCTIGAVKGVRLSTPFLPIRL